MKEIIIIIHSLITCVMSEYITESEASEYEVHSTELKNISMTIQLSL